ncbi:hypothetical protein WH47_04493 [Habropoda laboriosa]|uniref:Uncharacterized protein n=1 Tax=Habropoda laboriosa TaxID=597456 RepID=A0A0L7R208_9HYME|nr:hypothetical protein WH47_04493 [Habropoda laboriosa]
MDEWNSRRELTGSRSVLKSVGGLTARFALKSNIGPYALDSRGPRWVCGLAMEGREGKGRLCFIVRTPWWPMVGQEGRQINIRA